MQDCEIIGLCLSGNTGAYEELVNRYQRLVYSIALNLLKDTGLAEDAAQEAFIKAYRNLGSYNPEYKFSTWVGRITYNTCIDILRKQRESTPLDEAFEAGSPEASPEEAAISNERKKKLESLIGGLDPKYRQPLMLYHISGLKYEEIAVVMKVPMTIVKNRIFRARKMLKEALKEY
jgi:RNA polymerase sigma-70 factor (ECF subfamily)